MEGYAADKVPDASHGVDYPQGWQNWAAIAVSHRTDNNTLRVILGNDVAVKAARAGNTNPWPDNAILGKVVWKDTLLENWQAATAPGKFVHAEFMFKDSKKYTDSYGWGWARWVGLDQKPFNKGMQVCISCHTPVKDRDWVFTDPAAFPEEANSDHWEKTEVPPVLWLYRQYLRVRVIRTPAKFSNLRHNPIIS